MSALTPVLTKGRLWKIATTVGGLPKALQGGFTSEVDAKKAIRMHQALVQSRVKPTAHQKRKAREMLNG